MSHLAAKRYAKALFDLANEQNQIDSIYKDIQSLFEIIQSSTDLVRFLKDPLIPLKTQQSILRQIFESKVESLTLRFLIFLAEKDRLNLLKEICESFEEIYFDHKGIVRAKITAFGELSKTQLSDLVHHLKLKLRKEIQPQLIIDRSILGGLKIQIADDIQDFSFLTQLEKIKKQLKGY